MNKEIKQLKTQARKASTTETYSWEHLKESIETAYKIGQESERERVEDVVARTQLVKIKRQHDSIDFQKGQKFMRAKILLALTPLTKDNQENND